MSDKTKQDEYKASAASDNILVPRSILQEAVMDENMTASRIKFLIAANDAGIIPFCNSATEFRDALATLSSMDRRIAKRKFRKQWRKLAKKLGNKKEAHLSFFPEHEKENNTPSKRTKRYRQDKVLNMLVSKALS